MSWSYLSSLAVHYKPNNKYSSDSLGLSINRSCCLSSSSPSPSQSDEHNFLESQAMQQGDFSSSYYPYPHQQPPPPHLQNPNPNPNYLPDHNPNPIPKTYASAPPFDPNYSSSGFPNYPSFPQNPDPVNPNLQPFNPSPQQPSPSLYEPHGSYQSQPQQQQSYYPPFDQHQAAQRPPSSVPPNPIPNPNDNSSYSAPYLAPYSPVGASVPPVYDNPYDNYVKFDHGGGYLDENSSRYGGFSRTMSDLGSDSYGNRSGSGVQGYDLRRHDGVRPYEGSKVEPYGSRGTAPKSSTWAAAFDDYGRSISLPSGKDSSAGPGKIVRAVPKAETQQDVKSGVQKFRVKLLAESSGQSNMDVLCQIGLDGIRMLDPNTNRSLRIYPLDTITGCEVAGSSTFAFWSKSSVDIEPRRIRLQSNSYTTNTILDTVTAATVQLNEMGGGSRHSDVPKTTEQSTEKKKGFTDWMTKIKPANEEKDHWVPDEAVSKCTACGTDFGAFVRRHHCRNCGDIFCDKCTHGRIALTNDENAQPVRVCDRCLAEVTHRLSNAKEVANKPLLQSHEDLARKLQEEMERNHKSTSGAKSDGSGRRMREVACPICTVHLQVQVPSSGSETIECGVCQHPFLVSAH